MTSRYVLESHWRGSDRGRGVPPDSNPLRRKETSYPGSQTLDRGRTLEVKKTQYPILVDDCPFPCFHLIGSSGVLPLCTNLKRLPFSFVFLTLIPKDLLVKRFDKRSLKLSTSVWGTGFVEVDTRGGCQRGSVRALISVVVTTVVGVRVGLA